MKYKIIDPYSITRIIREYPQKQTEIKELEYDIINRHGNTTGRGSSYGDPTAYKGIALSEDKHLNELRREQEAMEKALQYIHRVDSDAACEDQGKAYSFIKLFYWDRRYNFYGARPTVGLSKRKAERYSRDVRFIVASYMGKVKVYKKEA